MQHIFYFSIFFYPNVTAEFCLGFFGGEKKK